MIKDFVKLTKPTIGLVLITFPLIVIAQSWKQIGSDIDGEYWNDDSGNSVSLSADGRTLAIGAPDNGENGHVRVFYWEDCLSGGIIYNTETAKFNFCEDEIWV